MIFWPYMYIHVRILKHDFIDFWEESWEITSILYGGRFTVKQVHFSVLFGSFTYWIIKHVDPQILKTKHLRVSPELGICLILGTYCMCSYRTSAFTSEWFSNTKCTTWTIFTWCLSGLILIFTWATEKSADTPQKGCTFLLAVILMCIEDEITTRLVAPRRFWTVTTFIPTWIPTEFLSGLLTLCQRCEFGWYPVAFIFFTSTTCFFRKSRPL